MSNDNDINYNYNDLPPFKWYVLSNFPFIEADFDAITNYQLLCKIVEYLNMVIASQNNVGEQVELLTNAFNNLKDYVDTYFEELDLQEEVNIKLDEMAENGTLTNLIKAYVDPIYQAYENEINETVQEQNQTIQTQSEQIDVLEGRVDEITTLPEGSTSGDAELADIRIGADGKTYPNAGTSVRTQIAECVQKYGINQVTGNNADFINPSYNRYDYSKATSGYGINSSGEITIDENFFVSDYINVKDLSSTNLWRKVNGVISRPACYYVTYNEYGIKTSSRLVYGNSDNPIDTSLVSWIRFASSKNVKDVCIAVDSSITVNANNFESFVYGFKINNNVLPDKLIEKDTLIVDTNGSGDYTSLLEALKNKSEYIKKVKVLKGTYNIKNEYEDYYGNTFFSNYSGYSGQSDKFLRGIWLENIELEMDADTILLFDYNGDNANVRSDFAIISTGSNVIIKNGIIKGENSKFRYHIHDDFSSTNEQTNIFENIIFEGNPGSSAVIGGGCGMNNTYIVRNCLFVGNNSTYDISYHNHSQADAHNKIIVEGCYGSKKCAFRYMGNSTKVTSCLIHSSRFSTIECVPVNENVPHENMVMYKYNCEETNPATL